MHKNSLRSSFLQLLQDYHLDAFLIATQDPFGNEYVGRHWALRAAISHFHGSAGTYLLTKQQDYLLTDSRYWTIAEQQQTKELWQFIPQRQDWIDEVLTLLKKQHCSTCGFDPLALSCKDVHSLQRKAKEYDITIVAVSRAYQTFWTNRPDVESVEAFLLDQKIRIPAESSRIARLQRLRQTISPNEGLIITSPADIAWLLHIRAYTKTRNPHVRAYAYIDHKHCTLYTEQKLNPRLCERLANDYINVAPFSTLSQLLQAPPLTNIYIDPTQAPYRLIKYTVCQEKSFPIEEWRSQKEVWEIAYIEKAMLADAVAHAEWQSWLDQCCQNETYPSESRIAQQIIQAHQAHPAYLSESFSPIVAHGAHAAMPHYETPKNCQRPIRDGLLLVDCGAHYLYGTTDSTRMIPIGCITEERKEKCTLVLKGMIALSRATFTSQTPASQLDAIARAPLQAQGLDFGHGTGHGIGFAQCVHEGPYRISPRFHKPLPTSLLISNEPGYYQPDNYGIRIENTLLTIPSGDHLAFRTMNLTPIRMECIATHLLTTDRIAWINTYHATIAQKLASASLSDRAQQWLKHHTQPIQTTTTSIPTQTRLWWM